MKTYSDNFSGLKRLITKVGNRIAITAFCMLAAISMIFAQEPISIIEGSIRSFSVENHDGNTFQWNLIDDSYAVMGQSFSDFHGTENTTNVTVRFTDLGRLTSQLIYLTVTETGSNGCFTTRAIPIMLEPNNMYLEFASAITQDCFTGTEYNAPLRVGLNFKDKAAGVAIPESRFPLKVTYSVRNITAGTPAIAGNSNNPLTMAFDPTNEYFMLVTEAVGLPNETTEYELTITSVKDKYDAEITNNSGDIRLQIRVINHLPQSGNMDMALAYYEIVR